MKPKDGGVEGGGGGSGSGGGPTALMVTAIGGKAVVRPILQPNVKNINFPIPGSDVAPQPSSVVHEPTTAPSAPITAVTASTPPPPKLRERVSHPLSKATAPVPISIQVAGTVDDELDDDDDDGDDGDNRDDGAAPQQFSTSPQSLESLRARVAGGELITLREMYPSGVDWLGRPVFVEADDWSLHWTACDREWSRLIGPTPTPTPTSTQSGRLESRNPDFIRRRRTQLEYYRRLLLDGMRRWPEYVRERDAFLRDRKVPLDDDGPERTRFDDEYRAFLVRRDAMAGRRPPSRDQVSDAEGNVMRLMNNARVARREDAQIVRLRWTEEFERWKIRAGVTDTASAQSVSASTPALGQKLPNSRSFSDRYATSTPNSGAGGGGAEDPAVATTLSPSQSDDLNILLLSKSFSSIDFPREKLNTRPAAATTTADETAFRTQADELLAMFDLWHAQIEDDEKRRSTDSLRFSDISSVSSATGGDEEASPSHRAQCMLLDQFYDEMSSVMSSIDWSRQSSLRQSASSSLHLRRQSAKTAGQRKRPHSAALWSKHECDRSCSRGDSQQRTPQKSRPKTRPTTANILAGTLTPDSPTSSASNSPTATASPNLFPRASASPTLPHPTPSESPFSLSAAAVELNIERRFPQTSELLNVSDLTENWQVEDLIGVGAMSRVFRARRPSTEGVVALKCVRFPDSPSPLRDMLIMEVSLWRTLSHPNVVTFFGYELRKTDNELRIALEYCERGSLLDQLERRGFTGFPEPVVARWTRQVLEGLRYLHAHDIIHRDLKPANILLTESEVVKITDFGCAKSLMDMTQDRKSYAGTLCYCAPEVLLAQPYSFGADIWSLGCTALELLSGSPPFAGQNSGSCMRQIVEGPHPTIPPGLSSACSMFLKLCFQRELNRRPTASDLLLTEFIVQYT